MIVGMTTIIDGIAGLKDKVGEHLGYSDYVEITQEQVNLFADATGDHQWIHVDPERAKKESPFGGPIAHGYLTLSLGPTLAPQIMRVDGITMAVNYGCEKVRFPSPGAGRLEGAAGRRADAAPTTSPAAPRSRCASPSRSRGPPKPSCVADIIFRYYELRRGQAGPAWWTSCRVHGRARPRRLTSTPSEKARSPEDSTSSLVSDDTST